MKNTTAETILYYENFADSYVNETINCNFTDIEKKFCKYVKPGGNVLDVGCGSGRDAKYFIDKRGNCDEPGIYTRIHFS